jgi:hypothetical protein
MNPIPTSTKHFSHHFHVRPLNSLISRTLLLRNGGLFSLVDDGSGGVVGDGLSFTVTRACEQP